MLHIKNKMETYCVKCKKDTKNNDSKTCRTKNNRLIMQSKCPACRIKNQDLLKIKKQKDY